MTIAVRRYSAQAQAKAVALERARVKRAEEEKASDEFRKKQAAPHIEKLQKIAALRAKTEALQTAENNSMPAMASALKSALRDLDKMQREEEAAIERINSAQNPQYSP